MSAICSETEILVVFQLKGDRNNHVHERTVSIPSTLPPDKITTTVKQRLRPFRHPDPSDNYAGQDPNDIQIINLVNLSSLL